MNREYSFSRLSVLSVQLLRCLTTTPTGDKMAYDIGFTDNPDRSNYDETACS